MSRSLLNEAVRRLRIGDVKRRQIDARQLRQAPGEAAAVGDP